MLGGYEISKKDTFHDVYDKSKFNVVDMSAFLNIL